MKEHADQIRAHHAEAFRQARRHTRTCRACFTPIMDAEGNPGLLGEACTVGAVFLRNLIEAESMLRTSTQPAPQGQKEDTMGKTKKQRKAAGKPRKASARDQARGQVCQLTDELGGGPCGARATHRVWNETGKSCRLSCEKHVPAGSNSSRIGKTKEPRELPKERKRRFKRPAAERLEAAKEKLELETVVTEPIPGTLDPKGPRTREDGTMSGLDAAFEILKALPTGAPALSAQEITTQALEKGLWKPGGKTPAATLAAAIGREIKARGDASRFTKTAPGRFEVSGLVVAP